MHAEPLPFDVSELQDQGEGRSHGIHQGECIRRIMRTLDPARYGAEEALDPNLLELGFIWEEVLSRALSQRFKGRRQVEVLHKGIWRTLDGFDTDAWAVLESKATKISAANAITSARFYGWQLQTAGYCGAADTDTAVLKALFINGAYEKAKFGAPLAKGWRLQFTEREIQEAEAMIQNAAEEIAEEKVR